MDPNMQQPRQDHSNRSATASSSLTTKADSRRSRAKDKSGEEEDSVPWEITCICGQKEDDGEEMVECDNCKLRWEHVDCIFPKTKKVPAGRYFCHVCKPRPTELTREQARAYQNRVKGQKAADSKKKFDERAKRREEKSRMPSSSLTQSKGSASKHDKSAPSQYREIETNKYSPSAKRLLSIDRSGCCLIANTNILKVLKETPRVASLIVEPKTYGLVALRGISAGSFVAELCGHVSLENECPNRDLIPGSVNDLIFLFEKNEENLIIDARKCGNSARYLRRSCKPNAELLGLISGSELHIMITTTKDVNYADEISIEFEKDWKKQPRPAQGCACRRGEECEVKIHFDKKSKLTMSSSPLASPLSPPLAVISSMDPSMPHLPKGSQVTPTGRSHKYRLSEERGENEDHQSASTEKRGGKRKRTEEEEEEAIPDMKRKKMKKSRRDSNCG